MEPSPLDDPKAEALRLWQALQERRRKWRQDRVALYTRGNNEPGRRSKLRKPTRNNYRVRLGIAVSLPLASAGYVVFGLGLRTWEDIVYGMLFTGMFSLIALLSSWGAYGVFHDYQKALGQFERERDELETRLRELRRQHADALRFEDRFVVMGGIDASRCHALVRRHPTRGDRDAGESWIVEASKHGATHCGMDATIEGMWLAPSGQVYFVASGQLHVLPPDARGAPPTAVELDANLTGVWGQTDDFVLTWGTVASGGLEANIVYRFDGTTWTEMPSPEIEDSTGDERRTIRVMRGAAPDNLLAAGKHGLLSHYDGETWCDADVPDDVDFSGVHVESPDEMYAACGSGLFKGSRSGWTSAVKALGTPADRSGGDGSTTNLSDVAKFADRVWVASTETGLHTLVDRELVCFSDKLRTKRLEIAQNGKALLYVTDDAVGSTADGKDFQQWPISAPVDRIEGRTPDGPPDD